MQGRNLPGQPRERLSFRAVNRRGTPQHDDQLQRHHLLPRQLLREACFAPMLAAVGIPRIGFHDFRSNGMLLPAREEAARRLALPLHRGPHRDYNAMVMARVGGIERAWSRDRLSDGDRAGDIALMRLALLQRGLRRRLLDEREPYRLNRRQVAGEGVDFADLDAMAETLWAAA